jgi:hypothetical protein
MANAAKREKIQLARRLMLGLLCCAVPLSIHLSRESGSLTQLISPLKGPLLLFAFVVFLVIWPRLKAGKKR